MAVTEGRGAKERKRRLTLRGNDRTKGASKKKGYKINPQLRNGNRDAREIGRNYKQT